MLTVQVEDAFDPRRLFIFSQEKEAI